jgi:two-component system alkaline phosphatase synthesis response regulator PhoP
MTAKILVIDDEPSILTLVTAYLKAEGFEYQTATDGLAGFNLALSYQPDIIVLDVMLPGMDGIELLARLRRESNIYVILLTARAEETDKIVGLSVGADDYLTKPFSPRELVARIKAALRRIHTEKEQPDQNQSTRRVPLLEYAHLRIDPSARRVWMGERQVELTTVEFDLLLNLAQNEGRVLTREQLLEKVWGYDFYGDTRVVDVHVGHIRHKLGADNLIETIRGIGYRFEDREVGS